MTPNDIPQDLVHAANQAWKAAPQKRDGEPTRMRHALAAAWPEIERQVRAKVAAEIEAAAPECTVITSTQTVYFARGMKTAAEIARGARDA